MNTCSGFCPWSASGLPRAPKACLCSELDAGLLYVGHGNNKEKKETSSGLLRVMMRLQPAKGCKGMPKHVVKCVTAVDGGFWT